MAAVMRSGLNRLCITTFDFGQAADRFGSCPVGHEVHRNGDCPAHDDAPVGDRPPGRIGTPDEHPVPRRHAVLRQEVCHLQGKFVRVPDRKPRTAARRCGSRRRFCPPALECLEKIDQCPHRFFFFPYRLRRLSDSLGSICRKTFAGLDFTLLVVEEADHVVFEGIAALVVAESSADAAMSMASMSRYRRVDGEAVVGSCRTDPTAV